MIIISMLFNFIQIHYEFMTFVPASFNISKKKPSNFLSFPRFFSYLTFFNVRYKYEI